MERIESADDPRVGGYRHLTDAALRRSYESGTGLFVLEGAKVVARAIQQGWTVRSLLLLPRLVGALSDAVRRVEASGGSVLLAEGAVLDDVAGFPVHRGVLGLAERQIDREPAAVLQSSSLLVVVEGVNNHENLGAIFRNAAAFGADAVLMDPSTCDPLYRRSVRVSMGGVLSVPFARLDPWPGSLDALGSAGFTTIALHPGAPTVVDEAVRILQADRERGQRLALLVGAEGHGLTDAALASVSHVACIPMAAGVDSLNVATSLAVALHVVVASREALDDR